VSSTVYTPELQLETLFVLNEKGRIISTREPNPGPGPGFALIRGLAGCAWAAHSALAEPVAEELETWAREETPSQDLRSQPRHARRYSSLIAGSADSGPAFTFPEIAPGASDIVPVETLSQLERHFRGWTAGELPERSPMLAVFDGGNAVSVCFSARSSPAAAEAGVETAASHRGRGLAGRVTAAWAFAIRRSGRLPIYSTSWNNGSSLAVARRLGLQPVASNWSLGV